MDKKLFVAHQVGTEAQPDYMIFGPEGKEQPTFIAESPVIIHEQDRAQLDAITTKVAKVIEQTTISPEFAEDVGVEPHYARDVIQFDSTTNSAITYFGLDLVKGENGRFYVIEINPNNQSFLQRPRAESIGSAHNDDFVAHLIERFQSSGVQSAAVIGSRKNAFWRSHEYLARRMAQAGIDTAYTDIQGFGQLLEEGFYPDILFRCCNSKTFLYSDDSQMMLDYCQEREDVHVLNSLSAPFFGYRKFLRQLQEQQPDIMPLTRNDASTVDPVQFPWLKYEGKDGFSLVVNLTNVRKWQRDAILNALCGNNAAAAEIIEGKTNSGAENVRELMRSLTTDGGSYIFQQHINPSQERVLYQGVETTVTTLYRTTGVIMPDGGVKVSYEMYGCTPTQLSQANGKINAGTGIYIAPIIE